MFGWRLISRREETLQADLKRETLGALQGQIDRANAYIAKLERLLDHERSRIDDERERADRATDALLLQNGTPPVTATGRRDTEAQEEKRAEAEKDYFEQLAEISRECVDTHYDDLGLELPPELQEAAAELLKNAN